GFGVGNHRDQPLDEFTACLCAGAWFGDVARVIDHHFPNHEDEVPAGEGVVADVGDAVGREVVMADGQDFVLYRVGNPGIDAMCDDVVELAEFGRDVHEVHGVEVDVFQAERAGELFGGVDLAGGKVNADEVAFGQSECHRDEVAAAGCADFEDTAFFHRNGLHVEQGGDGG